MKRFISKFLPIKVFGNDPNPVDVTFDPVTNKYRLAVDQVVKVESLRGFSDIADNWIFINAVGSIGDTLQIDIGVSDLAPIFQKIFTIVAGDVSGTAIENRNTLTDRMVSGLNADSSFNDHYRAVRVKDTPIVIIKSRYFGESGESSTFAITVSGGVNAPSPYLDFVRRNKINSLSTDPRDERFGVLGISGNVSSVPASIGGFYEEFFSNPINLTEMSVDARTAQGGPYVYEIPINLERDVQIFEIRIFFAGNGINLGTAFGTQNTELTNGITLEIKADNEIKTRGPFKTNSGLKNVFAVGSPTNFRLDKPSGKDELLASFTTGAGIILRRAGNFGAGNDDYIKITLNDRFDNITENMHMIAIGFTADF